MSAKNAGLDGFDYETYARTSENNMPRSASFSPLTEAEQHEVERVLKLS
ncbi:hypothetical protein [Nonomuraea aurantiaca]|jgi:hypothetical protein|nr:hypothetical protein [Nonomuraea aurantiaca]MCA2221902.1 hypothetical protein [Nonomuraea aurantiaca]